MECLDARICIQTAPIALVHEVDGLLGIIAWPGRACSAGERVLLDSKGLLGRARRSQAAGLSLLRGVAGLDVDMLCAMRACDLVPPVHAANERAETVLAIGSAAAPRRPQWLSSPCVPAHTTKMR